VHKGSINTNIKMNQFKRIIHIWFQTVSLVDQKNVFQRRILEVIRENHYFFQWEDMIA
jgi:hypothetical protein